MSLIECVPNFSEGRDAGILNDLAAAVKRAGAYLLDRTSDVDHNRSVLTFAGSRETALAAALACARIAVERIDLRRHSGVHPRIGALDVLPFVPLEGASMEECVSLAREAGRRIWTDFGLPVYFYEAAASSPQRANLAHVRKQMFPPDLGGPEPHPTAGMTAVGARKFLIAYNVNLRTEDLGAAKAIARQVREASGGLRCVKALGLPLASRGQVQVSMNLTDFEVTPPHVAFLAVCDLARQRGVEVSGSELIGLIPCKALEMAAGVDLAWENFNSGMILETRLADRMKESARND
jgi:glutamate formiminotransferase